MNHSILYNSYPKYCLCVILCNFCKVFNSTFDLFIFFRFNVVQCRWIIQAGCVWSLTQWHSWHHGTFTLVSRAPRTPRSCLPHEQVLEPRYQHHPYPTGVWWNSHLVFTSLTADKLSSAPFGVNRPIAHPCASPLPISPWHIVIHWLELSSPSDQL